MATSKLHDTGGAAVCLQLHTEGVDGQTDVLCPIPNAGTIGVAGATPGGFLDRLPDPSRAGAPPITR